MAKVVGAVGSVVDDLHTSDEERASASRMMYEAETERIKAGQAIDLAQIEVNKVEAAHRSVWVAGWRPSVGWNCSVCLFYSVVGWQMIAWAVAVWAPAVTPPPQVDVEQLIALLMGLLGFGAYRTFEKAKRLSK